MGNQSNSNNVSSILLLILVGTMIYLLLNSNCINFKSLKDKLCGKSSFDTFENIDQSLDMPESSDYSLDMPESSDYSLDMPASSDYSAKASANYSAEASSEYSLDMPASSEYSLDMPASSDYSAEASMNYSSAPSMNYSSAPSMNYSSAPSAQQSVARVMDVAVAPSTTTDFEPSDETVFDSVGSSLNMAFAPPLPEGTNADAIDFKQQNMDNYNAKDFLPTEINDEWFETDFSLAKYQLNDDKLINTDRYIIGINTVGQSLKNASYDIRGTIPNPKFIVSPWGNSTIEPDFNLKPLC